MTSNMKRYLALVGMAVVLLVVAIGAVGSSIQSRAFTASGSPVVARDLSSAVRMSDVIVIGTVTAVGGTRNLARNPKDLTREDENLVVTGQDYAFAVDEALKGAVGQSITVTSARKASVNRGGFASEREYDTFVPLGVGTRYALLLRTVKWAPNVYATGFEPSRFELGGGATVLSNWREATMLFPTISTDTFIAALKTQVAATR